MARGVVGVCLLALLSQCMLVTDLGDLSGGASDDAGPPDAVVNGDGSRSPSSF